ncbi:hypothetical protein, partial [Francisella sp. SYW-2]|uniref:hypothetical protein n=1 Tax=Francisella sp. SYW-2 TaxID=2610886 RepID=UPI001CD0A631
MFNNASWNLNVKAKIKGFSKEKASLPYISTLLLIKKEIINSSKLAELCNKITTFLTENSKSLYSNEIENYKNYSLKNDYYLVIIGKECN